MIKTNRQVGNTLMIALGGVSLLLIVGGAGFFWWSGQRKTPQTNFLPVALPPKTTTAPTTQTDTQLSVSTPTVGNVSSASDLDKIAKDLNTTSFDVSTGVTQ